MARREDRREAIKLRKRGRTYSEIRQKLGVPKSTLSGWLGGYHLSEKELAKLKVNIKQRKYLGIEKTRITKAKRRQKRLRKTYKQEERRLLPLTKRELYLCGLFLYWGEGVKGLRTGVSLNNTDPKVIKFYYLWMTGALGIPKGKIKVAVHLYEDMDVEESLDYWSRLVGISRKQFIKPYIKKSNRQEVDHKGFGCGTCRLYVYDQQLKEKIMLGLEALANYYYKKKQ
ncbi:MAG: helix-turn-helix domain-containing protein [Microgenomates group bacterium]